MKPYRLEMGTKLNIDNAKNLYEFWGDDLKNKILLMRQKNFGEIINYFNQNNIKIEDISTDDGDLEDVFVQLTKH